MDDDELPDAIYARVTSLSERGNIRLDVALYDEAIAAWEEALGLLPPPQAQWDAAMWLHASIGDALKAKGDVVAALDRFRDAGRSSTGSANAFVQFNIGACELDLGRANAAVDPLLRAYMLAGQDIFDGEDPKYLNLLRMQRLID